MMEVPICPLNAEGGQQLIDAIAPTEILADIRIRADQGVRGFGRHNRQKHGSTIDAVISIRASTVTEHVQVHAVKDALGQLFVFASSGGGQRKGAIRLAGDTKGVIFTSACGISGSRALVFSNLRVFITITLNPDFRRRLSHDRHDVAELFFPFEREAQIVQRNVRAVERGVLEVVVTEGLTEFNRTTVWCDCVSGAGSGCRVRSARAKIAPSGLERAVCVIREGPLVNHYGDGITHFIGPSILLDQFEPRALVDSFAVDIRSDTAGFFYQQLLDVCSRISHVSSILSKVSLETVSPHSKSMAVPVFVPLAASQSFYCPYVVRL